MLQASWGRSGKQHQDKTSPTPIQAIKGCPVDFWLPKCESSNLSSGALSSWFSRWRLAGVLADAVGCREEGQPSFQNLSPSCPITSDKYHKDLDPRYWEIQASFCCCSAFSPAPQTRGLSNPLMLTYSMYRESLKNASQVVWNWVKKLHFVYLLQAGKHNFFTHYSHNLGSVL